jgi:photosystem II stability/assembly factor-like uncharacterized protein
MNLSPAARLASALAAASACAAPLLAADSPQADAVKKLQWRAIGPANPGGRVTDIAGIPGDPSTFYVAPANGGLLKTTNGGTTFKSLFDKQPVASVGAVAIAPSDRNVVWVGTGEGDPRNTASFGNGVYRSLDGGESWTHLGLADTERIKRIRVDPRDPDTAYVCALGHEWGPNEERGVFKTTDGGKTWSKVLYKDKDTGCSDIDMEPSNPRILYAGMYTYRRKPWRFDSGGGETALYKSGDGGASWTRLSKGLPKGPMDRIGVAISRSDPETVYMITETRDEGVLFRSDDRGESWSKVNDDRQLTFRPFYYSDIRVDPNDPQRVYALAGGLWLSRDGGKRFDRIANNVHGDHQALWIDPTNSQRVLSGSDGGYQVSYDGARTFEIVNNVPISQFYHVAYDMRQPYYVCGGLQDNGNWCGPSATAYVEGIRKDDWFLVSYGDGFFAVPDPRAPHLVYSDSQGGVIYLTDTTTGAARNIHPHPVETGSAGNAIAAHKYRFNWNAPIALSPHDPSTVYFGGNVVFKTRNRGQSWEVISPDLTTNDKSKQASSGGPVVVDNTAAEFHCTILTIAESPVQPGVIWVGTDDGNVQLTRDGGKKWTNVASNIRGLPAHSWIPSIEASHFDAGTAYVAVDRHRDDDFAPWAFKTTDYGQTWTSIKGNLPAKGYLHVVREDPKVKNLLYAGSELGIFASWDGGARWASIRNNLPPVAVNDIQVHPRDNDLIVGTHSRGAWILDDITPLQRAGEALLTEAHLFDMRPGIRYHLWNKDGDLGQKTFAAPNPPYGAIISYYLKSEPGEKESVTITVSDKDGKLVREIRNAPKEAGVNRTAWNLRYEAAPPTAAERARAAQFPGAGEGGGGRFGGRGGALALPGEYTVKLKAGKHELAKTMRVVADPRIQVSEADLRSQFDALMALRELTIRVTALVERTEDLTKQLTTLQETLQKPGATATTTDGNGNGLEPTTAAAGAAISNALDQLKRFRDRLTRPTPTMSYRQAPRIREEIASLSNAIGNVQAAPTEPQKQRLQELTAETERVVAELNGILNKTVPELNSLLAGSPHVVAGAPVK